MITGIVAGRAVPPALSIDREVSDGQVVIAHRGGAFLSPETTDVAYTTALSLGQHNLEMDVWENSVHSMTVSHDATVTYVTTTTANVSSLNDAAVAALVVDSGTWFGVTYGAIHVPLFRDMATAHLGDALFWVEIKDGTSGTRTVNELIAASVPLNQACVCSFSITDLGPAVSAGYRTKFVGTTSSVLATALANNIDFVAYRRDASASLFSTAAAAGVPAFAYTCNRRTQRNAMYSAGAVGVYSDDPVYLSSDTPYATTDAFAAQTWMPGMIPANPASESRPTLAERGRFFASDYWGFSETTDTKTYTLQGWACPIKGDINADNFTIDLKITFDANSAGGTTRWASVFIADGSELDNPYDDNTLLPVGYNILFRKNGSLEIFRRDVGSGTNIAIQAGSAITTGTEVRFKVVVSPTAIAVQRLDGGGSVVQSASASDTTYRGGYFHLGKFGLACKFRDITIT